MYIARHAAAPPASRVRLAAWAAGISFWTVLRVIWHVTRHDPDHLGTVADAAAGATLAGGILLRWVRTRRTERAVRASGPAEYDLLCRRMNRVEGLAARNADRLDGYDQAFEILAPDDRPRLRLVD